MMMMMMEITSKGKMMNKYKLGEQRRSFGDLSILVE